MTRSEGPGAMGVDDQEKIEKKDTDLNLDGDDDDEFGESGDLSGDGGVVKEILTPGEGWIRPEVGDELMMHYKGCLEDGTVFDSSYDKSDGPFKFKLGDGKVIKGWDIVGKTMAKGEKARVTLKPEYGYGEQGSPPKIPPSATLVFEMELIGWQSKRDVYSDGLVMKTEIETGEGWERPGDLAEVTLEVKTTLLAEDGKTRLEELHSGAETFALGSGEAPEVWNKVVLDMKKKARVVLVCKPPHTKGPRLDYVPDDAACVEFDMTLTEWLKVEDIHSDGSLVKKIMEEGEGWERPKEGSTVTANISYFLYDSAIKGPKGEGPFLVTDGLDFVLGDGIVIDGIDRVVQSMKTKEVAVVKVCPEHAFKSAEGLLTSEMSAKGVEIGSTLWCKVHLLKFEKAKDMWSMSFEEKADEMQARKEKGNELIKSGRIQLARKSYDRAIAFFDSPTSELETELKKRVNQLLVQCHSNLAVCHDRLGNAPKVMEHCKKALEIAPGNVKALYRRGCAYMAMDDYYNAESDLKYALSLSPGNLEVKKKLKQLSSQRAKQDAKDRKLFSNLFGRLSKLEEKEMAKSSKASAEGYVETGAVGNGDLPIETVDATMNSGNTKDVEMKEATATEISSGNKAAV